MIAATGLLFLIDKNSYKIKVAIRDHLVQDMRTVFRCL